jgi:hypothetical protein
MVVVVVCYCYAKTMRKVVVLNVVRAYEDDDGVAVYDVAIVPK